MKSSSSVPWMIGKQTLVCCRQFMSRLQFTRHFFSSSEHALIVAHHTAWLNLHGPPCHAPGCCLCFDSLFLTLFLSVCFSYLFFFFYQNPQLNLFLHHRHNIPLALRQQRSLAPWSKTRLLTGHEQNILDLFHDSKTTEIFFPGAIQRHGALALVRCGTRRRNHRQSALFTTVHSRARRTSRPKTSSSLF